MLALLGKKIAVALPDTLLEEKESQRDKTTKLGIIARACAIYGVDSIDVFRDEKGRGDGELMRKVLEYLETPQYLRKRIFPIDDDLRFAGILPPLRIPSHTPKVQVEKLVVGDVREGVTNKDGTVDLGLEESAFFTSHSIPGVRVTVRISSKEPLSVEEVKRENVKKYWGYSVRSCSIREVFSDQKFGFKVATSRFGKPLAEAIPTLRASIAHSSGVKLVFGSPSRGLFEMLGEDLRRLADYVVNLFSEQQVETVRTEEALMAGLGLVNILSAEKA